MDLPRSKQTTNLKGTLAEILVSAELVRRNCHVFTPLRPDGEVDLVVMSRFGKFLGLQVRTAHRNGKDREALKIHTTRWLNGRRAGFSKSIDSFIASNERDFWVIPAHEVTQSSSLGVHQYTAPEYLNAWDMIADAGIESTVAAAAC